MSLETLETLRRNLKKARDNCNGRAPAQHLNELYGDIDSVYWRVINTTLKDNWHNAKSQVARIDQINETLAGNLNRLQDISDALKLLDEAVNLVRQVLPIK